jgi:16S rRNA (guanine966-N2)-methyltransferase
MRIISGKYKGQRLLVPREGVRPTTDRLRGSLFSALGQDIVAGSRWVDAFAGSGAVGIEALSRGAEHVFFSDRNPGAVRILRTNLERCGIEQGASVVNKDVFVLLRKPSEEGLVGPVDFLFLDPPYDFGRYRKLMEKVLASPLVGERTLIILEVFKKIKADFIPDGMEVNRRLTGGDSHLLLLSVH